MPKLKTNATDTCIALGGLTLLISVLKESVGVAIVGGLLILSGAIFSVAESLRAPKS